jgi:integrase/recombinase XerD
MNPLAAALQEYIAIRRALGFELRQTARTLPQFVSFLEREQKSFITTELALRWAQEKVGASSTTCAARLAMIRRFAVWRSATDPRTEIPPVGLLPSRYRRPAPYIYTEEEIERIISFAGSLPSAKGLRGLTCSTLFGLLAVSGMRVGEAVALDREDVDLQSGVLSIRRGKSGKSRFIPIHSSTRDVLENYAKRRDAIRPAVATPAFFVSDRGRRMTQWSAQDNFVKISRAIGLRPHSDARRFGHGPRLHDLRHRFAVFTLVYWYRSGVDVDREIPKLATYLGHNHPDNVYWYLQAIPELLELATERCERVAKGATS